MSSREHSFVGFVPSRVEGMQDVSLVTVWPDRLEMATGRDLVIVPFSDIAEWPRPVAGRHDLHARRGNGRVQLELFRADPRRDRIGEGLYDGGLGVIPATRAKGEVDDS